MRRALPSAGDLDEDDGGDEEDAEEELNAQPHTFGLHQLAK